MQVNPGEAFTIRREDGQFQCITGKTTVILLFLIFLLYFVIQDSFLFVKKETCRSQNLNNKTWTYVHHNPQLVSVKIAKSLQNCIYLSVCGSH